MGTTSISGSCYSLFDLRGITITSGSCNCFFGIGGTRGSCYGFFGTTSISGSCYSFFGTRGAWP